ncbi:hypothetical protein EHYA_02066 [Embleya hyalina]|uniref:Uncharacterized protein n=1 Tax=Embleya hyalina TaxID=516124 RepID=A0A401YIH2_9ACTN|nr:hypothetical protein EHYA_02066 [Embleya hyalina]
MTVTMSHTGPAVPSRPPRPTSNEVSPMTRPDQTDYIWFVLFIIYEPFAGVCTLL